MGIVAGVRPVFITPSGINVQITYDSATQITKSQLMYDSASEEWGIGRDSQVGVFSWIEPFFNLPVAMGGNFVQL
jgi:hypothetical protein